MLALGDAGAVEDERRGGEVQPKAVIRQTRHPLRITRIKRDAGKK
jgi:hypothetical protein